MHDPKEKIKWLVEIGVLRCPLNTHIVVENQFV